MYHNGYIMVDCGGLELNSAEKQTIDSDDGVTVTNLVTT